MSHNRVLRIVCRSVLGTLGGLLLAYGIVLLVHGVPAVRVPESLGEAERVRLSAPQGIIPLVGGAAAVLGAVMGRLVILTGAWALLLGFSILFLFGAGGMALYAVAAGIPFLIGLAVLHRRPHGTRTLSSLHGPRA